MAVREGKSLNFSDKNISDLRAVVPMILAVGAVFKFSKIKSQRLLLLLMLKLPKQWILILSQFL